MSRYRTFSNAKNRALQALLLKTRARVADELRHFMLLVNTEVTRVYDGLNKEFLDPYTMSQVRAIDAQIDRLAYITALEMTQHWIALRKQSFALAHAAEQQALINDLGGRPARLDAARLQAAVFQPTPFGPASDRAYLALSRLRRAVIDAVELSRTMGSSLSECIVRVNACFPAAVKVKSLKVLPKLREAEEERPPARLYISDFLSDEEWDDVVGEYKSKFIPAWRDPRKGELPDPVSIGEDGEWVTYAWQLERDITDDFVDMVRKGEHAGAREQGITDFIWIAVIGAHGKTGDDACEYCQKRDGLTSTEIETKIKEQWSGDPEWTRKSVPPIHPHCFCRLAPVTQDLPERPEAGEADFEEWLNS